MLTRPAHAAAWGQPIHTACAPSKFAHDRAHHPWLVQQPTYPHCVSGLQGVNVVFNASANPEHVAVIGGGGSGHEPAMAGYVGPGMLTASVCGSVFASPTAAAVSAAIRQTRTEAGCLLVILNYTGDCLNFGLAEETAKCEGTAVDSVIVQDDCGVPEEGIAGRRGIAGAVLVAKVRQRPGSSNTTLAP